MSNRRDFIKTLLQAGAGVAINASIPTASAQTHTSVISMEGWGLKLPENPNQAPIDPDRHLFRAGIRALIHADLFAHAFMRVGPYDIHGLPTDPITGARRDFNDLSGSVLQVFVMTHAESAAERERLAHASLPSTPIDLPNGESNEVAFGKVLDMADALNRAAYRYVPVRITRPPENSNAAFGAIMSAIHACPPYDCPAIAQEFPAPYKIPGINAGLASRLHPATKFETMALKGANLQQLATTFNSQHVAEIKSGILHQRQPVSAGPSF